MRTIRPAVPLAESILGKSVLRIGQQCRPLTYLVRAEHADGTLLYNVMTKAIVLLTPEEAVLFDALPAAYTEAYQALADMWFIVPADNDDMALSDGMKNVVMALDSQPRPLTSYTIFTTTDCNARCFYCFEAGTRRYNMTEQTAHDVAAFIVRKCEGKPVSLHWFGGEPLFNSRVIDIICADLRQAGIEYKSTMISNGYLFDEEMIRKAVSDWKLTRVQITLDGTEEQYNRRKAYVRPEGSPYQRVLGNIELLDKAGIAVHIRLNTELANAEDISLLVDELRERFRGHRHIMVYIAPIFENLGTRPVTYNDESRAEMHRLTEQLQQRLIDEGLQRVPNTEKNIRYRQCMADNESSTTILPDGRLGRCEHYTDSETYGSIYSDERDEEKLCEWRKVLPKQPECSSCFHYPACVRLAHCPNRTEYCDAHVRGSGMVKLRSGLLATYERCLSKLRAEQDEPDNPAEC